MNIIDSLFSQYQQVCIKIFAASIQLCSKYGSHKWGVAVAGKDHIRLLMGSVIVATIEQNVFWVAIDIPNKSERANLDSLINWSWTPKYFYKRPPSTSAYYWPMNNHPRIWPTIQRLQIRFLSSVADTYDHLRSDSQTHHSDELLRSLEQYLDNSLPRPDYSQIKK